jgi:uncharacterized membrane protein YphA (DoxX/SURF4 family)
MVRCADQRRRRLQKLFSIFPDGWPGVGLVILRIAVAINAIAQGLCALAGSNGAFSLAWASGLFAIISGIMLLLGLLTPVAAIVLTLGYLINCAALFLATDASKHANAFTALYLAAISMALVLLGPGALSVDARLFGRVEIIIPEGRRPPR